MRAREVQSVYRVRTLDVPTVTGRPVMVPAVAKAVCAALVMPNGARLDEQPQEYFCALALTTKQRFLSFAVISMGSLDATIVHPREVFAFACVARAASLIVTHNHPSGDPRPSVDDVELTTRLMSIGVLMGIPVLDHVIVGHDGAATSLREAGLL